MWKWMVLAALFSPSLYAQSIKDQRLATKAEAAIVLEASRSSLKDPDSARVTNLVVMKDRDGSGLVFCGFLNGRNSYGGYTGGQLFGGKIATKGDGTPLSATVSGMDDAGTYAGSLACKDLGFGKP